MPLAGFLIRKLETGPVPIQIVIDPSRLSSQTAGMYNRKTGQLGAVEVRIGALGLVGALASYGNGVPKRLDTLLAHELAHAYGLVFEKQGLSEERAGSIENQYRHAIGLKQRDGDLGVTYKTYP